MNLSQIVASDSSEYPQEHLLRNCHIKIPAKEKKCLRHNVKEKDTNSQTQCPATTKKLYKSYYSQPPLNPCVSVPHNQNCKFFFLISHWLPKVFVYVLVHRTP